MNEMKQNILIDSTLSWNSTQYDDWINSLKRDDTCFVQSLVEGRHESLGGYFWRYQHARIVWSKRPMDNNFAVSYNGNLHDIPGTGVWEPQFGIKRLVPHAGNYDDYGDVLYAISINRPIYEPRVDLRKVRKWIVPLSEASVAARNGAIALSHGSQQSLVLCAERPSPSARCF